MYIIQKIRIKTPVRKEYFLLFYFLFSAKHRTYTALQQKSVKSQNTNAFIYLLLLLFLLLYKILS